MTRSARLLDTLAATPVVGILRRCPPHRTLDAALAAVEAGLQAVEVTMDSEDAAGQIKALDRSLPAGVALGAGTVRTVAEVDQAVAAGATFLVSPAFEAAVVQRALDLGVEVVPGTLSPTEIAAAVDAGATLCKLFPSGPLGPGYLRALRGPFPQVPFLCTGGIDTTNAVAFLDAGAKGVGLSDEIFDPAALDTSAVAAATAAVLAAIHPGAPSAAGPAYR